MEKTSAAAGELRDSFGPDMRLVQRIAATFLSNGGKVSTEEVVRLTRIDFSTVRSIVERDDWNLELANELVAELPHYVELEDQRWARPDPSDPFRSELCRRLSERVAGVPTCRPELDHIQATVSTVVDRALVLARSLDLDGVTVLMLGDHDLTSLAIAEVEPRALISVVDIDEALLSYIASQASVSIRTLFCDLRLGLPPSLLGHADVIVTDPPYSVPGMALFVNRARAAMRPVRTSRMAIAYGYSSRASGPAHTIQSQILEEALLIEALLPSFNRYEGAPAIGMQADLIVAKPIPTRRQWLPTSETVTAQVYSHGTNAVTKNSETASSVATANERDQIRIKPVGESPSPSRIDRLFYGERPSRLLSGRQRSLVADLDPGLVNMAFRLALAAPAVEVIELNSSVPIVAPEPGLERLIRARWSWKRTRSAGMETIIFQRRLDLAPGETGAAYLASRGMSKLRNAAIEARISSIKQSGGAMSKREARIAFGEVAALAPLADDTIIDLPDWALQELVEFVDR